MRPFCVRVVICLSMISLTSGNAAAQNSSLPKVPTVAASPQTVDTYLHAPLAFERRGTGANETWVARGQGYAIGLQRGKATVRTSSAGHAPEAFSIEFAGGRSPAALPGELLPGKVNYIHGNDPKDWRIGLATYDRATYRDLYPGIDLVCYGNQQEI